MERQKQPVFFILFFVCSLLFSCRPVPQYPEELLQANHLTQTDPDSALQVLEAMSSQMQHATEPILRYYQLLTIKAKDKAFVSHTSDSLILSLLHYYEEKGDIRLLPEACYYAGRVTSDLGDAPQAIEYFHKAINMLDEEDIINRLKDEATEYKLKGCIHAQIANLLVKQNLYDLAISEYQEALRCDSQIGDTAGLISDYRNIGHALLCAERHDEAIDYFHLSQNMAYLQGDSIRYTTAIFEEVVALMGKGEIEKAKKIAELVTPEYSYSNQNFILSALADLYCATGNIAEAESIYKQLLHSRDIRVRSNANHWMARYAMSYNHHDQAILYLDNAIRIKDSLRVLQNNDAVANAHSFYNYQLRERENKMLKDREVRDRFLFCVIGLAFFLTLCFLTFIIWRGKKERDTAWNQYRQVKYLLDAKEGEEISIRKKKEDCLARLHKSDLIIMMAQKCDQEKPFTDEDWEKIQNCIKENIPEFLKDLHSVYLYNDIERKVSILIKLGFTPAQMAFALGRAESSIYSCGKRLYQKVFGKKGTFKEWAIFVKTL